MDHRRMVTKRTNCNVSLIMIFFLINNTPLEQNASRRHGFYGELGTCVCNALGFNQHETILHNTTAVIIAIYMRVSYDVSIYSHIYFTQYMYLKNSEIPSKHITDDTDILINVTGHFVLYKNISVVEIGLPEVYCIFIMDVHVLARQFCWTKAYWP